MTTKSVLGHVKTTDPDIEHWWAVEAMIALMQSRYQVIYGTRYKSVRSA
ncbi:MAG: hypothetical protein U0X92_19175 [Anaerolineales bacterium]